MSTKTSRQETIMLTKAETTSIKYQIQKILYSSDRHNQQIADIVRRHADMESILYELSDTVFKKDLQTGEYTSSVKYRNKWAIQYGLALLVKQYHNPVEKPI